MILDDLKLTNCSLEETRNCGVYTIEHIAKPGVLYVGSTTVIKSSKNFGGFRTRWQGHLLDLSKNRHASVYLQNVVNKYGIEGLRFDILDICEPKLAVGIEQYWINVLNSTKYGYNSRSVASSNFGHRLTGDKLISFRLKCKKRVGIRNSIATEFKPGLKPWNKGITMNEKQRNALKVKHAITDEFIRSNKKRSESSRSKSKRIIVFDINHNPIVIARSIWDVIDLSKLKTFQFPVVYRGKTRDSILREQSINLSLKNNKPHKGLYFSLVETDWDIDQLYLLIPLGQGKDISDFVKNNSKEAGNELINNLIYET